jgi:hypothetical protein
VLILSPNFQSPLKLAQVHLKFQKILLLCAGPPLKGVRSEGVLVGKAARKGPGNLPLLEYWGIVILLLNEIFKEA